MTAGASGTPGLPAIRIAVARERVALEALQLRASLIWDEYREQIIAAPDAVDIPAAHIAAGYVWVAQWPDGAIAGFSVVIPRDDGGAELDGLFVEPDVMRRGIGTHLVREAERRARHGGVGAFHVVANPRAQAFYRACGFVAAGSITTRFGVAVRMRKTLSTDIDIP